MHTSHADSLVTSSVSFHSCNDGEQRLFAVQAGIPLPVALESACYLLDAAEALVAQSSSSADNEHLSHACGYLIEMAKAAMQACLEEGAKSPG
ncbi:DUF3077 domain-containing protein [Pseudomonas indica]|uniref:DUF3077 domain-containing protein n=1 Tax=Pseudomonas indica TaxID=137658 RepID=A0A1G8Z7L0_9PSED|nr:DUF3077 domain-containing protein [Pseudomonas indica]MBU3055311.1 DUF3077 domain-containing protein [Pseudomonas indica]SDK11059.1 Protein of unknown function [Pseudomonas indica]